MDPPTSGLPDQWTPRPVDSRTSESPDQWIHWSLTGNRTTEPDSDTCTLSKTFVVACRFCLKSCQKYRGLVFLKSFSSLMYSKNFLTVLPEQIDGKIRLFDSVAIATRLVLARPPMAMWNFTFGGRSRILKNIEYHGWKLKNIEHLPEKVLNTECFTWQIQNTEYSPKNYEGMGIFTSGKLRNTEFFLVEIFRFYPDLLARAEPERKLLISGC